MRVIKANNVNDGWQTAKYVLNSEHYVRPSRVGEVWEYPSPVTTEFARPWERVLFDPVRNANPFFHFFEALWMLAGRNDLKWLEYFNAKISEFVGKGPNLHDSYGHRWRVAFDLDGGAEDDYADQLKKIARMLRKNHDERRAVLTMWNPLWDLERPDQRSVPCNTQAYFKMRNGKLTMTVTCRSNDICLGLFGANCVHFSMLHEYMAGLIEVPMGHYWQISDSFHAYTSRWNDFGGNNVERLPNDMYPETFAMVQNPFVWDTDLKAFMEYAENILWHPELGRYANFSRAPENPFFECVAFPLLKAWCFYKLGDIQTARLYLGSCQAVDWRYAATQWLLRIEEKRTARTTRYLTREEIDKPWKEPSKQ